MARTPVLTSTTLTPFGGGGGGFGPFSVVNPGREAYLTFLKVQVGWESGEVSNTDYLAAYQVYVNSQAAGSSGRLSAEQNFEEAKYRLERNDLLAAVENGTKTADELVAYDRSRLEGLRTDSQEYLDRLNLFRSSQEKAFSDAAQEQHDLWSAGKMTTAQLRSWYVEQSHAPDLALNRDLADQIGTQLTSLDTRLVSEADQTEIEMFNDGKVGIDAFLTYATAALARYQPGTEDAKKWTGYIDDAKQAAAETSLTYRYGLSQDYIQLQKYIADQRTMLAQAGASGTSTSQRIVLGSDGQWKVVTQTKTTPYTPSASEQRAMRERRLELADAERQLAEWTTKINAAGGFLSTDQMIGYYQGRQASVVKGTDEWFQLQTRVDSLQQQKHTEQVLAAEGVKITFGASSSSVQIGAPKATGGGGGYGAAVGGRASGSATPPTPAPAAGPLSLVTGTYTAPHQTPLEEGQTSRTSITTRGARFPTNLDGSAFTKFYSGFVAAYKAGETTFTDYSSGKPITYYIPDDLAARATMMGQLDDLRIGYYATRADVYAGTSSEYVASKDYSDAIKDKADNAYMILVTKPKGAQTGPILDPIAEGQAVYEQATAYVKSQAALAEADLKRGDVAGAWAHVQLATRTAAETEAKMNAYGQSADAVMTAIRRASGETAPSNVQSAFEKLQGESTGLIDRVKSDLKPVSDEVFKWAQTDASGNPVWNADGSMSLRDGAALFLTKDGKVTFGEVPSAGYAAAGSSQQVPDVPGKVRVTVNVGGFSPTQVVYADWTTGAVGFDANGNPIQGKVVSTYLNGKKVTLVENPFSPGSWALGNQTFKVPTTFKATATAGVYTFTGQGTGGFGQQNYLLMFDNKTGLYNLVIPGTAFTEEQQIPITQPDALGILNSAGFKLDLSTVDPADYWKYGLSEAYLGFTKTDFDRLQEATRLPPRVGAPLPSARQLGLTQAEWREGFGLPAPPMDATQIANLTAARAEQTQDAWYIQQMKRQAVLVAKPPEINPVALAASRAEDLVQQAEIRQLKSTVRTVAPLPTAKPTTSYTVTKPPANAPTSQQTVRRRRAAPTPVAPLPTVERLGVGPLANKFVPGG